jgi:hypothetical protein
VQKKSIKRLIAQETAAGTTAGEAVPQVGGNEITNLIVKEEKGALVLTGGNSLLYCKK